MAVVQALLSLLLLSPALAQVLVTVDPFNGDDAACSSAQEKMGGGACKFPESCTSCIRQANDVFWCIGTCAHTLVPSRPY